MANIIELTPGDVREALRIIRERERAKATVHNLEHELVLFEEQLAALYRVPAGYVIRDFTIGFEPIGAGGEHGD